MDIKVKEAQEWLNATYIGHSWYTVLDNDGITGAATFRALCKALQYELGLSGIDGIIGSGTLSACPTIGSSTTNVNLIKILQCGFYCKGYECGGITGVYYLATQNAATAFRKDVGFTNNDGTMPPRFIKALLNTDAYVLVSSGTVYVRNAQQYLNTNYIINLPNWSLIPCNGVPDRNMMKAIIAALQYEEANHTTSGVDGIYGNNTLTKAPILTQGTTQIAFVKVVQMCLMCMMETNAGLDGVYDDKLAALISEFQEFYQLPTLSYGTVDRVTWASLLSSKGDTTRAALACDTSVILNSSKATALYNSGYRYIGRYLTGTVGGTRSKAMTKDEVNDIFNAGLRIFAIFQDGVVTREKFTYEQGRADAATALEAARALGIPYGENIYFAIDYDMTNDDVTNYVIPYFRGIRKTFNSNYNRYKSGIYGARNVCSRVASAGYSVSSFVSDMSTGFSGNLGYKIPNDWAFDQFYEYTYMGADANFALDKVAYSGRYRGFDHLETHTNDDPIPVPTEEILLDRYREILKEFNVTPSFTLALNNTYHIETPMLYIEYKAGHNVTYLKDSDCIWTPELIISNGTVDSETFTLAQSICNEITSETALEFTAKGGVGVISSLCNEMNNGKISIGIKTMNGNLAFVYSVEQELWTDSDGAVHKLSVEITIECRNQPTPQNVPVMLPNAMAVSAAAVTVGVLALVIVYTPGAIPALSAMLSAFVSLAMG